MSITLTVGVVLGVEYSLVVTELVLASVESALAVFSTLTSDLDYTHGHGGKYMNSIIIEIVEPTE